jgi:GT2 family glycosyltransferase
MSSQLDILIPTYNRANALAVTLTSLISQTMTDFRVVVSDQSTEGEAIQEGEVLAATRILAAHGNTVEFHRRAVRRGMAEQRQYLLEQVHAPYALYLDDDLILEPFVLEQMLSSIEHLKCGFVGSAVLGLSYIDDVRPHEQAIEFWEVPVEPENVHPDSPEWQRYRLHNAANLYHLQKQIDLSWYETRFYKVAWVGGCVLYNVEKLHSVGGFSFWEALPGEHCGEDVLAQLRVMAHYGGCGLIPSGVYHLELPTTVSDRRVNAPQVLDTALLEGGNADSPPASDNPANSAERDRIFHESSIQIFP